MTQPNQGYDNTGGYGQSANPYGQPNIAGQPSYGQPNPHDPGNQYGQSNPYGQPDPYQAGGYPQSGQQGYDGQPGWGMQQKPAKRPAWRTSVGWIFVALTGLFTLSAITQLASGRVQRRQRRLYGRPAHRVGSGHRRAGTGRVADAAQEVAAPTTRPTAGPRTPLPRTAPHQASCEPVRR